VAKRESISPLPGFCKRTFVAPYLAVVNKLLSHHVRQDQDVELLLPGSSWRVIAKSVCQYTSVCIASIGSCLTSESILKVERTQCGDSGVLFD